MTQDTIMRTSRLPVVPDALRVLPALLTLLALTAPATRAQTDAVPRSVSPLASVPDTIVPQFAAVSPNGKWLLLTGQAGHGVFLSRAGTDNITRITSAGFDDRVAVWFPSGDRILFTSDRPNREGGHAHYGMVLDVDTARGAAVGDPRQVRLDSVVGFIRPSPDGALIAYATAAAPHALRVIPANGGAARTLATSRASIAGFVFSPDMKSLYFTEDSTPGTAVLRPNRFALNVVPLQGAGGVRVVARAPNLIEAYGPDPRYIVHRNPPQTSSVAPRLEITTADGRKVGELNFPESLGIDSDGYRWTIQGPWHASDMVLRLAPVDGGETRSVTSRGQDYLLGWTPDGKALLSNRTTPGDSGIMRVPVTGGAATRLPIRVGLANWRGMLPDASIAIWDSVAWSANSGPDMTFPFYATDLRTGATSVVTRAATRASLTGRGGGMGSDWSAVDDGRFLWTERAGDSVVIYAGSSGTDKTRIRAFPAAYRTHDRYPMSWFAVHGSAVAWLEVRGDSAIIFIAPDAHTTPRAVLKVRAVARQGVPSLVWSNSGRRLAVAYDQDRQGRGPLIILDVNPDGTAHVARRTDMEVAPDITQWLPDDSGIIAFMWPRGGESWLAKIPVNGGAPIALARGEGLGCCRSESLSPDGRWVAYTIGTSPGRYVIYDANVGELVKKGAGR
jgi:Tol biopolymer transport system component